MIDVIALILILYSIKIWFFSFQTKYDHATSSGIRFNASLIGTIGLLIIFIHHILK